MNDKGNEPPDGTPAAEASPRSGETPPRERIERSLDWLEGAGLGVDWAERFVYWLKHFGAIRAIGVLIAVALPVLKYVWIPTIASRSVSTIAEGYGIEVDVGDWSGSLLDLRATAQDVKVRARGNYARDEIFTARSATLDLSFWRRITKGQWIDEVEIHDPTIYAERLLSGRWNWQDAIAPTSFEKDPPETMLAGVGGYRARTELRPADDSWSVNVPLLRMDGLRIQWVENIPGASGSGVIQTSKATVYIDDVRVVAKNFYRPAESGDGPLEFSLEGRTADGRVSLNGLLNPHGSRIGVLPRALASSLEPAPRPPLLVTSIYLENVGVAALAAIVYEASIIPAEGTVTGRIDLVMDQERVDCLADVMLRNVKWRPQEAPSSLRPAPALIRQLEGLRADGRVKASCDGRFDGGNYRPITAIHAAVASKALEDAPAVVRAFARLDEKRLTGNAAPMTTEQLKSELSEQLRTAGVNALRDELGEEAAALTDRALPRDLQELNRPAEGGNPVSRGWKRLRNGWRRLTS